MLIFKIYTVLLEKTRVIAFNWQKYYIVLAVFVYKHAEDGSIYVFIIKVLYSKIMNKMFFLLPNYKPLKIITSR